MFLPYTMSVGEEFMLWEGPGLLSRASNAGGWLAHLPRSRVIPFSWGLVSFNNFKYVASICESFDADLPGGIRRGTNKSPYQSHKLPHHPAKLARYPSFDRAREAF